ncbi:MAG: T9SS type A sorting domain-containing protein, partial [Saprospiraceae bacterium]|nr:T9SS type A sorting domain-containing protein [Saprospiraceae bacterium]
SLARNNIIYNTGGAGIGFFAARNCSAYHNTVVTASGEFHAPLYISPGEIWIDDNTTLTPPCFNIEAYNNIFRDQSGTGDEDYTVQIREGGLSGTNLIDYNIYQKTTGAARFDDGVSWPALSFSQWKSQMGFDAHSQEAYPQIDGSLHLLPGSPAIDAGRTSPAAKDYEGLVRTGVPDIGADEYNNGTALQVPPPIGVIGTGVNLGTTTIQDVSVEARIEYYPNPANDLIFIQNNQTGGVTLTDLTGRELRSFTEHSIPTSDLPNGIYLLNVESKGMIISIPVIIHH